MGKHSVGVVVNADMTIKKFSELLNNDQVSDCETIWQSSLEHDGWIQTYFSGGTIPKSPRDVTITAENLASAYLRAKHLHYDTLSEHIEQACMAAPTSQVNMRILKRYLDGWPITLHGQTYQLDTNPASKRARNSSDSDETASAAGAAATQNPWSLWSTALPEIPHTSLKGSATNTSLCTIESDDDDEDDEADSLAFNRVNTGGIISHKRLKEKFLPMAALISKRKQKSEAINRHCKEYLTIYEDIPDDLPEGDFRFTTILEHFECFIQKKRPDLIRKIWESQKNIRALFSIEHYRSLEENIKGKPFLERAHAIFRTSISAVVIPFAKNSENTAFICGQVVNGKDNSPIQLSGDDLKRIIKSVLAMTSRCNNQVKKHKIGEWTLPGYIKKVLDSVTDAALLTQIKTEIESEPQSKSQLSTKERIRLLDERIKAIESAPAASKAAAAAGGLFTPITSQDTTPTAASKAKTLGRQC